MKKTCVALLAVLMSCVFIASCQKTAAKETTTSSVTEPNCVRPAVWITLSDKVKKAEK